jgi:hypothetical protein
MRKLALSLGIAFLAVSVYGLGVPGQAQETCNLRIGTVRGGPGQTIAIPIGINAAPNAVDALGFDLTYDPTVLQYTGTFTRGPLVAAWSFFDVSHPQPGRARVGGFTAVDPILAGESGTVVELEFLVVCGNCVPEDLSALAATNLVDDIASWSACSGTFHFLFCVDGEGVDVGNSRGPGGGMVSIPVTIQGALNDADALGFDLLYDPQVLQFTGMLTREPLVANWNFVVAGMWI